MYNRYKCPLQACSHLTLKLFIQDHPQSAKVTHIGDFKSAYISLIIGPRGFCSVKPTCRNSCAANLLMFSYLTFDPSFGQMKVAQLKSADLLIIGPRALGWSNQPIPFQILAAISNFC